MKNPTNQLINQSIN